VLRLLIFSIDAYSEFYIVVHHSVPLSDSLFPRWLPSSFPSKVFVPALKILVQTGARGELCLANTLRNITSNWQAGCSFEMKLSLFLFSTLPVTHYSVLVAPGGVKLKTLGDCCGTKIVKQLILHKTGSEQYADRHLFIE
jgi:hypothetical protein